jgi:hypothetical protein
MISTVRVKIAFLRAGYSYLRPDARRLRLAQGPGGKLRPDQGWSRRSPSGVVGGSSSARLRRGDPSSPTLARSRPPLYPPRQMGLPEMEGGQKCAGTHRFLARDRRNPAAERIIRGGSITTGQRVKGLCEPYVAE